MEKFKQRKLITHDGSFHADDVFACAVILLVFKDNLKIIRTSDERTIKQGDIVVDTGRIYNPKINRFDHHQEGLKKRKNGLPYASFGLVWNKFGKKLCNSGEISLDIEKRLVIPIDASDNGIDLALPKFSGFFPYQIQDLIFSFIPKDSNKLKESFLKCVKFAKQIILNEIGKSKERIKIKIYADKIYKNSKNKKIIVFDKKIPRQEAGEFLAKYREPLFMIMPSIKGRNEWKIVAIPKGLYSHENRKNFPKAWAGKMDQKLADITSVKDSVFCHKSLFMAIAKSRDGAVRLAQIALETSN